MRRLTIAFALLLAGSGCPRRKDGARYLHDARFRRAALQASLVAAGNRYSQLRLQHYASGRAGDWDTLPEWNPPVAGVGLGGVAGDVERALTLPDDADEPALRALGREAFFRYPTQLAPRLGAVLARGELTPFGLWRDDQHGVSAIVSARLADGSRGLALTCATCHARLVDGRLVPGLANEALRVDALAAGSVAADRWGPGRVDVALPPGEEPVAIPDLRPTALLTHLQRDGAVLRRDRVALAIRIETLIITAHGGVIRPPRVVALALAAYLESLAPTSPPPSPPPASPQSRGATQFAAHCAGCHVPPGFAGPPVALDVIGTDDRVGRSADRGTGGYRVPSLRGVASRGRLLHDGSIAGVAALLDPARPQPGHDFGRALDADARADLVAYLQTL